MQEKQDGEIIENTATQNQKNPEEAVVLDSETRNWGMACHLASFGGFVIPFFNFLGPLIIWLIKKDDNSYIDHHGKESVNFQITILLAYIGCFFLSFAFIGLLLFPVVFVFWLVMTIIAGVKASGGDHYHYPLCLRLIK